MPVLVIEVLCVMLKSENTDERDGFKQKTDFVKVLKRKGRNSSFCTLHFIHVWELSLICSERVSSSPPVHIQVDSTYKQ